jgi:hypothetical protein
MVGRLIRQAERTGLRAQPLRLARPWVQPSGNFLASLDIKLRPRVDSPPRPSSASATDYAANPTDSHSA